MFDLMKEHRSIEFPLLPEFRRAVRDADKIINRLKEL
jgi:hypothetical protein